MANVLLVTVDCLRYDRCGFNGYYRNTTPTLDKIARDSLIFDHAYSTGPYTTESIPGILAGQHSYDGYSFGGRTAWKALGKDATLGTYFQEQGFQTGAAISNPHLSEDRNFDRGFGRFENLREDTHTKNDDESRFSLDSTQYSIRERMRSSSSRLLNAAYVGYRYSQYRTEWPTKRAEEVLEELLSIIDSFDSEFFAWTHLMDLHAPIHPDSIAEGGLARHGTVSTLFVDADRAGRRYNPNYGELYDSALRYVDDQIKCLIKQLKLRGLWDDTLLVFTADHGEALFDRNEIFGHPRHYHYDELLHVPLLLRDPEDVGGRIQSHVSLAWIHEILSQQLEIGVGKFPSTSGRASVYTGDSGLVISDTLDSRGHTISVRNHDEKVITHYSSDEGDGIKWEYLENPFLIRYRQDTTERHPACPTDDNPLLRKSNELAMDPRGLSSLGEGFSEETEEHLRDLGYVM